MKGEGLSPGFRSPAGLASPFANHGARRRVVRRRRASAAAPFARSSRAPARTSPQPDAPATGAPDTVATLAACSECVFAALPSLPAERMVDLLEFIAAQHSGSSFNPDNTARALDVAAFLQARPYPASKPGVAALARLARHALGSSSGSAKSAEHQLWLLTSGALNTAAAVAEFEGNAVALFDAVRRDGGVRGRYMQRLYATAAMEEHVAAPEAYTEPRPAAPAPEEWDTFKLAFLALFLCMAVLTALLALSETALPNLLEWAGGPKKPPPKLTLEDVQPFIDQIQLPKKDEV